MKYDADELVVAWKDGKGRVFRKDQVPEGWIVSADDSPLKGGGATVCNLTEPIGAVNKHLPRDKKTGEYFRHKCGDRKGQLREIHDWMERNRRPKNDHAGWGTEVYPD